MKRIESREIEGGFHHDRFSFSSKWLKRAETYSVIRPSGLMSPRGTLYYFHAGHTGDRMMLEMELFERMDEPIRDLIVRNGIQFATPNFGLNFLLSGQDDAKRAFSEYFFEEVIPAVENGTKTDATTRFLAGASLGGHTSLVAFLRRPELFKGVASSIGALLNFNFLDDKEFSEYVRNGGLNTDFASSLREIFHGAFESYDTYLTIDPLRMLDQLDVDLLRDKRILIDSGSLDDFGFHLGMSEFAAALVRKGVNHRFELIEGGRHEPAFVMSRFSKMVDFLLGGESTLGSHQAPNLSSL